MVEFIAMLPLWQQLITLILTPTLIIAVIAYVLRGFFQQLLSRDLENQRSNLQKELEGHKQRLQSEFETYKIKIQNEQEQIKLHLQNDLQKKLHEFQTKFSIYHQKQTEVVSELYSLLVDASDHLHDLIIIGSVEDAIEQKQRNNLVVE